MDIKILGMDYTAVLARLIAMVISDDPHRTLTINVADLETFAPNTRLSFSLDRHKNELSVGIIEADVQEAPLLPLTTPRKADETPKLATSPRVILRSAEELDALVQAKAAAAHERERGTVLREVAQEGPMRVRLGEL
jgi:hypothetical protein